MSPRDRTRQHMHQLLAAAAASAAIGGSCHHDDGHQSSYGVVDPMPPPARCPGASANMKSSASAKREGNETMVDVAVEYTGEHTTLTFQENPYVSPGRLVSSSGGGALKARVAIPLGATQATLSVGMMCEGGPQTLGVTITLASADAGAPAKDAGAAAKDAGAAAEPAPKIELHEY